MSNDQRPAWVGFVIDVVAILAGVALVILGAVSGRDALAWIAFVQTGRLYIWATRGGRKNLPSESGLLLLLLAAGDVVRDIIASRHHLHS